MSFQRCIVKKPLSTISLRDVAKEAGMSHPSLLHYFKNKDELIISYVRYSRDYMSTKCREWFNENNRSDFHTNIEYLNAFMEYVVTGKPDEIRPNATVQIYILGHYNEEVSELIAEEFQTWRKTMLDCLIPIYGEKAGEEEAEAMMLLISGAFICTYNKALTGKINSNILDYIGKLIETGPNNKK